MRRWFMLLVVCSLGFLALGCTSPDAQAEAPANSEPVVSRVDPAGFNEILQTPGTIVVDVRTPEEFAAGHLAGAINIDIYNSDFAQRISELDRARSYAVYCRSGNRSQTASEVMADSGFTQVSDLDGGINAWIAAGLPVIQ